MLNEQSALGKTATEWGKKEKHKLKIRLKPKKTPKIVIALDQIITLYQTNKHLTSCINPVDYSISIPNFADEESEAQNG